MLKVNKDDERTGMRKKKMEEDELMQKVKEIGREVEGGFVNKVSKM